MHISRKSNLKLLQLLLLITFGRLVGENEAVQNGTANMRILALFSTALNELDIDYRLGHQVLKLAASRARQLYPTLAELELLVERDGAECDSTNGLPSRVAEHFYLEDAATCGKISDGCNRARRDSDAREIELYLNSSASSRAQRSSQDEGETRPRVHAIIGPSCDFLVDQVARMAAYWSTPIYSVTSISASFARKDIYSTLTRLSPSLDQLSIFFVRTMQRFSWRRLAILVDRKQALSALVLDNISRTLARLRYSEPNTTAIEHRLFPLDSGEGAGGSAKTAEPSPTACLAADRWALLEARKVARVVLLIVDEPSRVRRLLLCGHELAMNDGEFTFLTFNLELQAKAPVPVATLEPTLESSTGEAAPRQLKATSNRAAQAFDWYEPGEDHANQAAREMFQSLMVFSAEPLVSDQYNLFVEQTLEALALAHPHLKYERTSVGPTAVALHDSLLLAVEAHLNGNAQLPAAAEPSTVGWNVQYNKGLTASLHINARGDQELDYVLSDMEPEMGMMRPVATYSKVRRQLDLLPESYIHWPPRMNSLTNQMRDSDEPPPDEPECGFTGDADRCVDRQNLHAALAILAILIALTSACASFSVYKYRNIRYQMQLDDYWWKVPWKELQFLRSYNEDSLVSTAQSVARAIKAEGSLVSGITQSFDTKSNMQMRLDSRRAAVPLIVTSASVDKENSTAGQSVISAGKMSSAGTSLIKSGFSSVVRESNLARYRGELVIVKQLNKNSLSVTRELLVELKSMRDYLCDNLAKFVGVCLESERLAIVYEFCSRGSLQDMLLNPSISMDWTLKYSIIGDVVNGLNFIHTTLLDYHGRLKSTNLVLDSRFTVKITDFGLQSLYSQLDAIDDTDEDRAEDTASKDEAADAVSRHGDQLSTIASAYNMESVSVVGARQSEAASATRSSKQRNRGATRYFWTAPEHLREKNSHCSGSKKGDVYAFAVILCEIITRKEPYHYGSSAKPNWSAIKRERVQLSARRGSQIGTPDRRESQVNFGKSEVSVGGSIVGLGRRVQSRLLRSNNSVGPDTEEAPETVSQASAGSQDKAKRGSSGTVEELSKSAAGKSIVKEPLKPIDGEEILDQLRMGIEPEPVRLYLPSHLLQDVNPRLVDLVRMCWAESPSARPSLAQIRNLLRRITKGVASRNYLDNLLERLQNYAENLEQLVENKSSDIVQEKLRTEELLYQLVPKFVAERLKREEPIVPQLFDGVTIFFSDIVGFEKYASVMNPIEQVDLLNSIYSSFDSVISSFDVTKIETIIDQFLVAAGISLHEEPVNSGAPAGGHDKDQTDEQQATGDGSRGKLRRRKRGLLAGMRRSYESQGSKPNSLDTPAEEDERELESVSALELDAGGRYKRSCAEQIARMALCIRDLVKSIHFRQTLGALKESGLAVANFNIRIGIHSGKVCAGIVGAKRPKFCLIGDTVNVASRMHTNSKANRIQISADTRELLEQVPGFSIEPRGKIDVKGKGLMETYWLDSSY